MKAKDIKKLRRTVATYPNNEASEKLTFSTSEAATALGVSNYTIYRLLARGVLKALPYFRHKRIPREELNRFVNGQN